MSDLPRSRATAVQALIDKWERRALALTSDREVMRDDRVKARVLRDCADDLAALLLREGPPQEPTEATESSAEWQPIEDVLEGPREIIGYNGDGAAGLREGQEPPEVCKTCQGRRWVMRSETRDYSKGVGAGGMWNQPCPDCTGLREGPPAPQPVCTCRHDSGMSTVCDVHYPAPHGHAGDVPATEPRR